MKKQYQKSNTNHLFFLMILLFFSFISMGHAQAQSHVSIAALKKQIALEPNNTKLIEQIADFYGEQKQWDNAIFWYKKLVDNAPENANYHYKYGGVLGMKSLSVSKLRALKYLPGVKKHFKTAAVLDPKHIAVRWALIELYLQLPAIVGGSNKTAFFYAKELQNISAIEGALAKGYIHDFLQQQKQAKPYFKKALELATSVGMHYPRNTLYYQIGKIATQDKTYNTLGIRYLKNYIIRYKSSDTASLDWAYYYLAKHYQNQKNTEKALFCTKKALALRPGFKKALEFQKKIQQSVL